MRCKQGVEGNEGPWDAGDGCLRGKKSDEVWEADARMRIETAASF